MITFDVKNTLSETLAKFPWVKPENYQILVSNTLNSTAYKITEEMKKEMTRVFDRPTPYALRSVYPWRSKPTTLFAEVRVRDFAAKGTPAINFLRPGIYGGGRKDKSFEKSLRRANLLPDGMMAVPAKDCPYLDQYGNIPGPFLNRVLSYIRANSDATQNRGFGKGSRVNSKGKRFSAQFFVRKIFAEDGLPQGVYEKKGGKSRMIIAFVKKPQYRERLKYFDLANRIAREYFPDKLKREAAYQSSRNQAKFKEEVLRDLSGLLG
jgi:hypothetical protein